MNLLTKNDLHIERKIFHLLGTGCLFAGLCLFDRTTNYWLLSGGLIFSLGLDTARLRSPKINDLVLNSWIGRLARAEERDKLSGVTAMILGVFICYGVFSEAVTGLAILFLGLGDPGASAFGLMWGKTKIFSGKSLEGTLAAALLCTLAYWGYSTSNSAIPQGFLGVFAGGSIGAFAELLPVGSMDDNLSQPLVSGALLSALFYFMN